MCVCVSWVDRVKCVGRFRMKMMMNSFDMKDKVTKELNVIETQRSEDARKN